ncbi:MAG: hypothetical protein HN986_06605 [Candidatus Marinimicrobia bacterium]|jgi:replicative DNA helicase|nr:hypothetical protein [Candidatus Neomarinimicrobiota bacterium]
MAIRKEHIVWNEEDVIGQMAVNNSIHQALKSGIVTNDFLLPNTRSIFKEMLLLADRLGRFKATDLLNKNLNNGYLLRLMDNCLMTNLKVKCNWIVELSVKRVR